METKMLLPVVPSMAMTAVPDNEDFSNSNYYELLYKLQKQQTFLKAVEGYRMQLQNQLLSNCEQWLVRSSNETPFEEFRRNKVSQRQQQLQPNTITATKKKPAEVQLQSQVPKSQPKSQLDPEPKPESPLNPEPKVEPKPTQVLEEYGPKPVSEYEQRRTLDIIRPYDLGPWNLNEDLVLRHEPEDESDQLLKWSLEPKEPIEQPDLKLPCTQYEEKCSQKNILFNLEDSESESEDIPLSKFVKDFENEQFKAYCANRDIKLLKKQIFTNRYASFAIMKPAVRYYNPMFDILKRTASRSLLKPRCINNTSSTNSESNVPSSTSPESIVSPSTMAHNYLLYKSDEEESYLLRCAERAQRMQKYLKDQIFKELSSWKDMDVEESDPFAEPQTDSEEEISFRHDQINASAEVSHISIETPSSSSSEASSSSLEAAISSTKASSSWMMTESLSNSNDTSQRITRRKHEEMQQQIANNIKRHTLNDHCYYQMNVPETFKMYKELDLSEESEEEEDENDEGIIDVVSIKKQVKFAKQVTYYNYLESQHNTDSSSNSDVDENEERPVVSKVRRRGRPPGSAKRKADQSGPAPKRARIQSSGQPDYQQPSTSYQYQNSTRQYVSRRNLSEDMERRRMHNDMERQRRINMKDSYEQLRKHVPAITNCDRASKVSILKQATTYIKILTEDGNKLKSQATTLRQERERLKRKLQELRNLETKSRF